MVVLENLKSQKIKKSRKFKSLENLKSLENNNLLNLTKVEINIEILYN